MSHFGVLSYKGTGHLNPLIALSKELTTRGHRVSFFLPPELEQRVHQNDLGFFPIDTSHATTEAEHQSCSDNIAGENNEMRAQLSRISSQIEGFLHAYPAAIRTVGVDALIMGEITLAGPTVAEVLHLPYFVVSTSIPHNFGWDTAFSVSPHRASQEILHAKLLEVSIFHMVGPVMHSLDRYRQQLGLRPVGEIQKTFPELAHITQWPRSLDFPRAALPGNFFYTGPFINEESRLPVDFPWEQLTGQPLIYVSLGTTRRADPAILYRISEACAGLDAQTIITLGGRLDPASLGHFPGNPLIVRNAPQLELLKRAEIVITHAGPNTVLETLLQGKPMIALPIALDQPAIAAHLARLKVAEVLPPGQWSAKDIRTALLQVRNNSRYREAAQAIQTQLKSLRGVAQAADIIESRVANHKQNASTTDHVMTVA